MHFKVPKIQKFPPFDFQNSCAPPNSRIPLVVKIILPLEVEQDIRPFILDADAGPQNC